MKVAEPLTAALDLLEARLSVPYPATAFLWFRRVFCLKVAAYGVLLGMVSHPVELLSSFSRLFGSVR